MTPIAHPTSPRDVTSAWLSEVLRSCGILGNGRVATLDIDIIGEDRGFTGVVARLKPGYEGPRGSAPTSLVAKFPLADRAAASSYRETHASTPEFAQQFTGRAAREVEFFRLAGSDLEQVPRCYFAHADLEAGNVLLLLEDLSDGEPGDALAGCSVDQARSVLSGIVAVHSRWWNDEGLSAQDWLPEWEMTNSDRVVRFRERVEPVIGRYGDRLPGGALNLLRSSAARFDRILADLASAPPTLVHLDLHLDNVIFTPDARIIDLQSVSRGPAMLDVAGFIVESLDVEDRRTHEIELLREYHDHLSTSGVTDYPFERLIDDYLRALLVRMAGNMGWLAKVEIDEMEGRERDLVEALLEPGRTFAALLDHEVDRRFGLR